jgi:hypothetical protein
MLHFKRSKLYTKNKSNKLLAVVMVVLVAVIGTYVLVNGHAATPYASIYAGTGDLTDGATIGLDSGASDGKYVQFGTASTPTPTPSNGGGNGTKLFDGTFDNTLSNFPSKYGTCYTVDSASELQMNITSSCNPAGNGHYRVDICTSDSCTNNTTGDYFTSGVSTCTSVPIDVANVPTVPTSSWFGFAQAKDNEASTGGWWFGLDSYEAGYNQFIISFGTGINNTAWYHDIPSNTWNTLSICTNNSNTASTGKIYGIYLNGVQQTFTYGTGAGQKSLSGFQIINDGSTSWPLSINDYTGGTPVPNEIIHGNPLIYTMGSNDLPPEPSGGWNSPD